MDMNIHFGGQDDRREIGVVEKSRKVPLLELDSSDSFDVQSYI